MTLILFLFIGAVCASENTTDEDIGSLIDAYEDQEIITLDEKTYQLNTENETHLYLNKTFTLEGLSNKTVIDGKNSTLYLDVEKEPENNDTDIIIFPGAFQIKNTGKHITFKNITFKDLNLTSYHKMDFIDCRFVNTNFTSKELNNSFDNCVLSNSLITLNVYEGSYEYYSKIANCGFYNSTITSKTNIFIHLVGSSRIFLTNSIDLINSTFISSDVSLSHYYIRMTELKFLNSKINGWSDIANISSTTFKNQTIHFGFSDVNFDDANLSNSTVIFEGGYFSQGCKVILKNSEINSSSIQFVPNYQSRQSTFIIENSAAQNCNIKTILTNIQINNSEFNKTAIESINSDLNINNSKFYNNGNISNTFKVYGSDMNTSNIFENSYLINNTGEYEIISNDINVIPLYKISFNKNNIPHYIYDNITFSVKDSNGDPVKFARLFIDINDENVGYITTDKNGKANYTINNTGKLNIKAYYYEHIVTGTTSKYSIQVNLTIKPKISDIKFTKVFKSTIYSKINSYLKGKIVSDYNGTISGLKVHFKVNSQKKYEIYTVKTDSNGNLCFIIPNNLEAGNHKIQVIADGKTIKTFSIKIQKVKTVVKAAKVTNKFKKSKYFKATIKNKENKKPLSNVKVKIKVFTGKKFKTYTVKTNKKGMVKINTKKLKKGNHKVVISSGNSNYKITAKSMIKIKG